MGKSINPMFSFTIRGEFSIGFAPSLIVLMSLQPAIPRQVALLQCLPPLHRLDSMLHLPAGTVNHHFTRAGEFSTGRTRNFQPELTKRRVVHVICCSQGGFRPQHLIRSEHDAVLKAGIDRALQIR